MAVNNLYDGEKSSDDDATSQLSSSDEEVRHKPQPTTLQSLVVDIQRHASDTFQEEFAYVAEIVLAKNPKSIPNLEGKDIIEIVRLLENDFGDRAASLLKDALVEAGYGADSNVEDLARLRKLETFCNGNEGADETMRGKLQFRRSALNEIKKLRQRNNAGGFSQRQLGCHPDNIKSDAHLARCLNTKRVISDNKPKKSLKAIKNQIKKLSEGDADLGATLTHSGGPSAANVAGPRQEQESCTKKIAHRLCRAGPIITLSLLALACVSLVVWFGHLGTTTDMHSDTLYSKTAIKLTGAKINNLYKSQVHVTFDGSNSAVSRLCTADCTHEQPRTIAVQWNVTSSGSYNCSLPIPAIMRSDVPIDVMDQLEYFSPYLLANSHAVVTTEDAGGPVTLYIYSSLETCNEIDKSPLPPSFLRLEFNSTNNYTANLTIPASETEGAYYCGYFVLSTDSCQTGMSSLNYSFTGEIIAYDIEYYSHQNMCQNALVNGTVVLSYTPQYTCVFLTQDNNGGTIFTSTAISYRQVNPSLVSLSALGALLLFLVILAVSLLVFLYWRRRNRNNNYNVDARNGRNT